MNVSFQECTSETTQVRAASMLRNVLKDNCKKKKKYKKIVKIQGNEFLSG